MVIHRVKNPFSFRIFAILCKLLLILFFLAHGQTMARHVGKKRQDTLKMLMQPNRKKGWQMEV